MARVVQRRSAPPYGLIITIILFFISTALAAVFYMKWNKAEKADLVYRSQKEPGLNDQIKATGGERNELIYAINGQSSGATAKSALGDAGSAFTEADRCLGLAKEKKTSADRGLANTLKDVVKRAEQGESATDKLRDEMTALNTQLGDKDKAIAAGKAALTAEQTAKKAELDQARQTGENQLNTKDAEHKKQLAARDAMIAENAQKFAALSKELDAKNAEGATKDKLIDDLQKKVVALKGTPNVSGIASRKPDGKIARVLGEQGLVYINLGQNDQVTPGLTFAVYSAASGIPEDGKGKAKIQVSSVQGKISEARIIESTKDDPIAEGDVIGNLVFNPQRPMTFVVEGEFNLAGQGTADPNGAKQIQRLIQGFGGKVSDELTLTTDYLIIGEEPAKPPKPAEDANAATLQIYNEKMKQYEAYKALTDQAKALQIPVLNTSRFLAFTGFVPKKRLSD